ncbi:MAG: tRNA threonylcarbamoyladenosine dehydratase [Treponema sp.]|nr:tRNA threonylcarbamoyladenosine dehydratase [Treponema sp.]
MLHQFSRTELLIGKEALEILGRARVAVFGIGGVGGYTVEALVRSGIQHIDIIDNDTVCLTNLNRQIIATHSSIGKYKVDVMKERILDINPQAEVNVHKCFYLPETSSLFDFTAYDYVVDAVDTVTAKINLIMQAKEAGTKIISCMGAGNKLDPTQFVVADISQTSVCPLARVMRQECKKRKIKDVKVLYSTEKALRPIGDMEEPGAPGSTAFVPSVAGLIIAGEVIKDLTQISHRETTDKQ